MNELKMLKKVLLCADVFAFCAAHAFVTEKEEIMGLLVGERVDEGIYKVSSALALKRLDKKPDRVEISPEQLFQATSHVERMSERLQRNLSIVGWYHSHPHITAMPSEVDIRTQASYQLLDQCFIGLILSVFNTSQANQVNRMQVCCFQSCPIDEGTYERVDVSIEVVQTHGMSSDVVQCFNSLPSIFFQEELEVYESFCKPSPQQPLTSLFNKSIFIKNLIQIMESIHIPLITFIENKIDLNKSRIRSIKEEKEKLRKELETLKNTPSTSTAPLITVSSASKPFEEVENVQKLNFSKVSKKCENDSGLTNSSHTPPITNSTLPNNSLNFPQNKTKSPHKFYGETSI